MRIPFTKFYQDAKNPTHHHAGDAGLDFYSLEYYAIPAHHYEVVKTGIRVEVPEGYVGLLFPKGGNSHVLGAGVIDTYYEGEVLFKVVNYFDFPLTIGRHDPIGQMIFVPFVEPEPVYASRGIESRSGGRGESGGIKDWEKVVDAGGVTVRVS